VRRRWVGVVGRGRGQGGGVDGVWGVREGEGMGWGGERGWGRVVGRMSGG